jgi:hypothetical protein
MSESHQSGTFTGYKPYYRDSHTEDSKWKLVPYQHEFSNGGVNVRKIPFPLWNGGVLQQIWLLGFEQANAIAYIFAADAEALGNSIEVKVEAFTVKYSIEYDKQEEQCKL